MTLALVNRHVPWDERRLDVTLLEEGAPWTSPAPIEQVLLALEQLGLGLTRASIDLQETWQAYDRALAVDAVWRGVEGHTGVALSSADGAALATVARYSSKPRGNRVPMHRNTVTLTLAAASIAARGLEQVEAGIALLSAALPNLSVGTASAAHQLMFPVLLDELQPPPPFLQTAWLHALPPRTCERFGGTVRLLATPVARAEQRSDGAVWLFTYPHPFEYDTEEAVAAMRALSRYLRAL